MCMSVLPRTIEVDRVPVVVDELRQLVASRRTWRHDRRPSADDARDLAAHGQKQPALLLVVVARRTASAPSMSNW